jgi:heat shock protein HtpX
MTSTNSLKSAALLALLTGLLVFIGNAMGGSGGMLLAFGFALVMNFSAYWYSDKLALSMAQAHEVSEQQAPELHRMVEQVAYLSGMPKPRVYVVDSPSPNAFATGRDPQHAAVAVTTGIMGLLEPRELAGVLAHELAHVRNRDTLWSTIAATIAGAISMIAQMAQWAMIFGGFGRRSDEDEGPGLVGGLFTILLAPLVATIIQLAVSRSREYEADATGARLSHDPLALASALAKLERGTAMRPMVEASPATAHLFIVNPFSGSNLGKLFSTHPPIEDRIRRLHQMAGMLS